MTKKGKKVKGAWKKFIEWVAGRDPKRVKQLTITFIVAFVLAILWVPFMVLVGVGFMRVWQQ